MPDDSHDPTALITEARRAPHAPDGEAPAERTAPPRAETNREEREDAEAGDLVLHYQPRILLDSGLRTGAEALVRWRHGRRGLVPPSVLWPTAEARGQITQLGGWMLQAACDEAARWGGLGVSVGLSPRQLHDQALPGQVAEALDHAGLAPELLELAVPESVPREGGVDTLLALSALRDLGVGIALDDYGGGVASLGLLKRLPLTALKLHRGLARALVCDPDDAAIARAIIQTAHALGFVVIADGVDHEAQREALAASGCDEAQGLLVSAPVSGEALRARAGGSLRERLELPRRGLVAAECAYAG
jgi:EAL domain-containing protein (putative c-di-GMP-specific phosphodiesterase class I)